MTEGTAAAAAVGKADGSDVATAIGDADGTGRVGVLPDAHAAISPRAMSEQIKMAVRVASLPFVDFRGLGWWVACLYTK